MASPGPADNTNQLQITDLAEVLQLLKRHGYSGTTYYELGLFFGLSPATLDIITKNNRDDVTVAGNLVTVVTVVTKVTVAGNLVTVVTVVTKVTVAGNLVTVVTVVTKVTVAGNLVTVVTVVTKVTVAGNLVTVVTVVTKVTVAGN
uniref:Death domain-containing protein n=1 Tax=Amphimedon queenslandica TaxID=400682 RepID=A0A1X7T333_AMPQE